MALLVAVLATLIWIDRQRPPDAPLAATSAPAAPPTASPTSGVKPVVTEVVERSSEWVLVDAARPTPTATATPWPTLPPPPVPPTRRPPTPTPSTGRCVSFSWSARQVFVPSAQVLVEINAVNRCNRDLEPADLWFEIAGWREGGLVRSVRGHSFDRIRRGSSGIIAIGLPGSLDWYDEMTVTIID